MVHDAAECSSPYVFEFIATLLESITQCEQELMALVTNVHCIGDIAVLGFI